MLNVAAGCAQVSGQMPRLNFKSIRPIRNKNGDLITSIFVSKSKNNFVNARTTGSRDDEKSLTFSESNQKFRKNKAVNCCPDEHELVDEEDAVETDSLTYSDDWYSDESGGTSEWDYVAKSGARREARHKDAQRDG